jgi:micrococcal nuclease
MGLLAGIAAAIAKMLTDEEPLPLSLASQPPEPWPPLSSDPAPPAAAAVDRVWVEPRGKVCPTTHPVKAKMTSKIFHLPGMANYDRTNPDRCYVDAPAAENDGLRLSKR